MERTIDMAIDKEVLDQLLAGRDPQEQFAKDGLLDEWKKALSERMLCKRGLKLPITYKLSRA